MKRQRLEDGEGGTIRYELKPGHKGRNSSVLCNVCGKAMRDDYLEEHFKRGDHKDFEKGALTEN